MDVCNIYNFHIRISILSYVNSIFKHVFICSSKSLKCTCVGFEACILLYYCVADTLKFALKPRFFVRYSFYFVILHANNFQNNRLCYNVKTTDATSSTDSGCSIVFWLFNFFVKRFVYCHTIECMVNQALKPCSSTVIYIGKCLYKFRQIWHLLSICLMCLSVWIRHLIRDFPFRDFLVVRYFWYFTAFQTVDI